MNRSYRINYLQRLINWVWYQFHKPIDVQPTLDEVLAKTMEARLKSIVDNVEKNNAVLERLKNG
jgi:hypothetical protein